jgi:hypothetical protein
MMATINDSMFTSCERGNRRKFTRLRLRQAKQLRRARDQPLNKSGET